MINWVYLPPCSAVAVYIVVRTRTRGRNKLHISTLSRDKRGGVEGDQLLKTSLPSCGEEVFSFGESAVRQKAIESIGYVPHAVRSGQKHTSHDDPGEGIGFFLPDCRMTLPNDPGSFELTLS
jgi:hypothetical protein